MAQTRDLLVRIIADTSKLNTGVDQTNQKLGALGRTAKVVGGAFAAYAAADVAIDFLSDATKAATEDAKAQAILANTLKNTTEATEAQISSTESWIEKTMFATGVADDQLRPALGNLVRATGDITEAQELMGLALDISAAKGIDLETVSLALAKAQDGNVGALQRLGVTTKDTSGATLEFEQVVANATETFGGSAQTAADTTAGKMQILKVRFDELKEQIGTTLIPVIEKLIDFLNDDLVPAIETVWPVVERVFNLVSSHVKNAINVIRIVLDPLMDLVRGEWGDAWDSFKERIVVVWEGIEDVVTRVVGVVKSLVTGMVTAIKNAINIIIRAWNALDFTFEGYDIPGPGPNIPGFTFGLPDIPQLAKGGTIARTGLAVVHQGETVTPRNGAGTGSVNIYGPVYLQTDMTEEDVVRKFNGYARRNGGVRTPGGVTAVS